jgi:hypothetical protein
VVNYALSEEFLSGRDTGTSGLQFEFASGTTLRVALDAVDSTLLVAAVAEGAAITPTETPEYEALATEIDTATTTLNTVNRTVTGTANTGVTTKQVDAAASSLRSALDVYAATPGASSVGRRGLATENTTPVCTGMRGPRRTAVAGLAMSILGRAASIPGRFASLPALPCPPRLPAGGLSSVWRTPGCPPFGGPPFRDRTRVQPVAIFWVSYAHKHDQCCPFRPALFDGT